MNRRLTAIVQREGEGYVALCPAVDVASQGDTVSEARDNLAEALTLFFETASSQEIDGCRAGEVYVTHVDIAVGQILSESGGTAAMAPRFDLARPGAGV